MMHRHGLIHRDIKLENILLKPNPSCPTKFDPILIDFGLSTCLLSSQRRRELVGSVAFISPEIASEQHHGFATDIWSMGIVLYALLTGRLPFLA